MIQINPSPKYRFRCSAPNIKGHRELLESDQLQMSLDFAMLQYQAALANQMTSNMEGAASMGLRLLGAQEFLSVFKMLSEQVEVPGKAPNNSNLDHKA